MVMKEKLFFKNPMQGPVKVNVPKKLCKSLGKEFPPVRNHVNGSR